jgi:hypothetical protein
MVEGTQSEAWAVAIFSNGSGDNALRQTEAIPAHLPMVIGERHHRQRGQRMGQYAGPVAIMRPERGTQRQAEIRGRLFSSTTFLKCAFSQVSPALVKVLFRKTISCGYIRSICDEHKLGANLSITFFVKRTISRANIHIPNVE